MDASKQHKNSESPSSAEDNEQQWHDIKIVGRGDGDDDDDAASSQELVIENLENLQETTALIVTRDL